MNSQCDFYFKKIDLELEMYININEMFFNITPNKNLFVI